MALASIICLAIGLFLNFLVFLSLPLITSLSFYTVKIELATPLTGTLNGEDPYLNLTSLLLGNWAVCFIDVNTALPHGILCTKLAVGYPVTLESGTESDTIVQPVWTGPLLVHLVALLASLSLVRLKEMKWVAIIIGINVVAIFYDLGFYFIVKETLNSNGEFAVSLGPDVTWALVSIGCLIVSAVLK